MSLLKKSNPLFTVVIPVLNQHEVTESLFTSWFEKAKSTLSILFIDNGSEELLTDQKFFKNWQRYCDVRCIRNEKNTGVYPTFQQGYEATDSKFIFFSHNDVEMKEYGWDEKLSRILMSRSDFGVCGMFGAKGIGTPDIYKSPYQFTQLMRWNCITVSSMAGAGGRLIRKDIERVVVLDGFSLITNREMIDRAFSGKFDHDNYPPHHNYDHDICLTSHFGGFKNYVIDIDCKHHGGATSTREKWAEEMGKTDLSIHRQAHVVMYEKYRGRLPVSVS